jgi:hypothetical protein
LPADRSDGDVQVTTLADASTTMMTFRMCVSYLVAVTAPSSS